MPANLTARYRKVEDAYRRAATPEEELTCLQDMLRELPKHKGTDKLQAELRQKISKAKHDLANPSAVKAHSVRIARQGAGQVLVIGGPNSGKSQLLRALTRATPEVGDYPFTTREPSCGMMSFEDILIQLVDTPPVTRDMLEPYMQGLIRSADLVLLVVDLGSDDGIENCQELIERLASTKTGLGTESKLDDQDIGRTFTQTFVISNKIDDVAARERLELFHELLPLPFREFVVSATDQTGLDELRGEVFRALDVVRVYTKAPSRKEPDLDKPFTLRRGGTLADVAALIHETVASSFKFGRVWGKAVHDGTRVKGDYVVHDKDIVEIHC